MILAFGHILPKDMFLFWVIFSVAFPEQRSYPRAECRQSMGSQQALGEEVGLVWIAWWFSAMPLCVAFSAFWGFVSHVWGTKLLWTEVPPFWSQTASGAFSVPRQAVQRASGSRGWSQRPMNGNLKGRLYAPLRAHMGCVSLKSHTRCSPGPF